MWGNTTKMSALSVKTNVHFLLMSALHWAAAPSLLNAGTRSRQGYKQKICRNVPRVVCRYVDSVDSVDIERRNILIFLVLVMQENRGECFVWLSQWNTVDKEHFRRKQTEIKKIYLFPIEIILRCFWLSGQCQLTYHISP